MPSYDPRITPARPDLAASHLAGTVQATRFVDGQVREIAEPQAPLRRSPSPDAPLETEALRGERVTIYESNDEGWSWGQLAADGYVGYMPTSALRDPGPPPTHRVAVPRTLVFPGPSIKLPPIEGLSFGCRLAITRIEGPLAVTASNGFVPTTHLKRLDTSEPDFVAVAETFIGVPYLWGGRTSLGIDCSGLVQLALTASGAGCPRDSDMQERALGLAVPLSKLQRGDLVFWSDHVAIARDPTTFIHANAFHMAVAFESAREAIARIAATGSQVTSVRRMAPPV
jgi:Bacterial dipeptidyl-peptidase Sh3 domain/NlpC/P60 family